MDNEEVGEATTRRLETDPQPPAEPKLDVIRSSMTRVAEAKHLVDTIDCAVNKGDDDGLCTKYVLCTVYSGGGGGGDSSTAE